MNASVSVPNAASNLFPYSGKFASRSEVVDRANADGRTQLAASMRAAVAGLHFWAAWLSFGLWSCGSRTVK